MATKVKGHTRTVKVRSKRARARKGVSYKKIKVKPHTRKKTAAKKRRRR